MKGKKLFEFENHDWNVKVGSYLFIIYFDNKLETFK